MQIFNALFFHATSIIIWVRQLKIAVLTLPHLYHAIQLEITSIQDKFCSNTQHSPPPSASSKKPEWNVHTKYDSLFLSCYKTHTKSCLHLRNQTFIILRSQQHTPKGLLQLVSHPILTQKTPWTSLQRQKMCNKRTDAWWAEPCSWYNL